MLLGFEGPSLKDCNVSKQLLFLLQRRDFLLSDFNKGYHLRASRVPDILLGPLCTFNLCNNPMIYLLLPHITKEPGLSKFKGPAHMVGNWSNWDFKSNLQNSNIHATRQPPFFLDSPWQILTTHLRKPRKCYLRAVRKTFLHPKALVTGADPTGNSFLGPPPPMNDQSLQKRWTFHRV